MIPCTVALLQTLVRTWELGTAVIPQLHLLSYLGPVHAPARFYHSLTSVPAAFGAVC